MVAAGSLAHLAGEFTVTVGFGFTVKVPDPLPVHADPTSVITTEYVPAVVAEKLATLPGLGTPPGTVHA